MRRFAIALVTVLALAVTASAQAFQPDNPWPPRTGPGILFVHYGEEHWNDEDGLTILPKVVADSARYRPKLVTMSGDKDNDGTVEQLTKWRQIMSAYDRAGVPYFAGVGNHDRDQTVPGAPPGTIPPGEIDNYVEVFKGRPYPMGDARRYADPRFQPRKRPAGDPAGAATHYFVDYGPVRWIFIDNSCYTISQCEIFQAPSAQTRAGEAQFDFLERVAQQGTNQGRTVFVVMHMPTQDPGDQSYREVSARMHVMGKGATTDNQTFEEVAERTGVDGVFLGHIKGQFLYRGQGNVPYYIDGGAGGELYTDGPIGTDHGYWHGFRLLRVANRRIVTDAVPIFVKGGIRIQAPAAVARGKTVQFAAFGKQPVFKDPAKVEALELRDPDPQPPASSLAASGAWKVGIWVVPPIALLLLVGWAMRPATSPRRRLVVVPVTLLALSGLGAVAVAQRSEPTTTPKENLPIPARIWTTSNEDVFKPVASKSDDPRRKRATQTDSGRFAAICPGHAKIQVTSGWEARRKRITSRSEPGTIVESAVAGAAGPIGDEARPVARVKLAQRAEVVVRVRRNGKRVRTLADDCVTGGATVAWDGRVHRGGVLKDAAPGRYAVVLRVRSDRPTVLRRATVVVE